MAIALSKAIGQDWLTSEKVAYYFCCGKLPVQKRQSQAGDKVDDDT